MQAMRFAIYDGTGRIIQICTAPSGDGLDRITPAGCQAMEVDDHVGDGTHYIRGGTAIEMPPQPSANHEFDYHGLAWVDRRSDEDIAREVRRLRDLRIAASDWVMLPDVSLGEAVKFQWLTYRQALRDISGQAGFPRAIEWPTKPS